MQYAPYCQTIEYLPSRQTGLSYIRVLHASPDAPGVDVYLNNRQLARNLTYRSFTPYTGVTSGNYSIRVFPAGQTINPVIDTRIQVAPNSIYTAAAIGTLANIEPYLIPDPVISPLANRARVRFVHLSPNAPEVDITLPDGTPLFQGIGYKEFTNYRSLAPGRYTLQARLAGTGNVVLNVPNIVLRPGRNLSIYAVGLAGGNPPLQVLIPLDGSSYLPV